MSKFRIAFDLDVSQIIPEAVVEGRIQDPAVVQRAITALFVNDARRQAKSELHKIRKDPTMDPDVKTIRMAEQFRKIMLTLMAESNMTITPLSDDVPISTELPFEREYHEAA